MFFFPAKTSLQLICYFRCVQNVKEWRKQTCPCSAHVLETLTWLSQPRFLLLHPSLNLAMRICGMTLCSQLFFPPFFLPCKDVLWADHSVSEHSVSLQHEIPGGDHWLVACNESTYWPKRCQNVIWAAPAESCFQILDSEALLEYMVVYQF